MSNGEALHRLAQAAEDLARACAMGRAPKMGARDYGWDGKPCCAVGHVAAAAGLRIDEIKSLEQSDWRKPNPGSELAKLREAVERANDEARHSAMVLVWIARARAVV